MTPRTSADGCGPHALLIAASSQADAARLQRDLTEYLPAHVCTSAYAEASGLPADSGFDAVLALVESAADQSAAGGLHERFANAALVLLVNPAVGTGGAAGADVGANREVIRELTPAPQTLWRSLQQAVWRNELLCELQRAHQQLARAHEHIAALTDTDPLTGVANRDTFERNLALRIAGASTAHDHVAVLCLDLDDFRTLNDQYGMAGGDEVLRSICSRMADILGPQDLIARVGADEFVCMLLGIRGISDAHRLARRIDEAARAPLLVADEEIRVQASIGIAMYPFSSSADALMAHADAAMRHAKRHARGGIQFFDRALANAHSERRRIGELLIKAVPDQLIVRYQGIYSARTGRLQRLEGLCNLPGDAPGPALFVPVADELGLTPALTERVINSAARDFGARLRADRLHVAINVTSRQLSDRSFPELLVSACKTHAVALDAVQIEVHEREILDQVNQVRIRQTLAQLRELGAGIIIDDFGTGFASVAQLVQLPVTGVKLDRSLVSDMLSDRRKSSLCRGCVEMAHGLGLEVTAVGIESYDDLMLVSAMGCDFLQGDYLCPPGAIDTIPDQVAPPGSILRGQVAG